jgi:hypothetical protein
MGKALTLPICRGCGAQLPPPKATGRPREYCNDACRKKHERRTKQRRAWRSQGNLKTIPSDPLTHRARTLELTARYLEGEPPAPPEHQLAQTLLELEQATFVLRRLAPELLPHLVGPAGELADGIDREIQRWFPGRAA